MDQATTEMNERATERRVISHVVSALRVYAKNKWGSLKSWVRNEIESLTDTEYQDWGGVRYAKYNGMLITQVPVADEMNEKRIKCWVNNPTQVQIVDELVAARVREREEMRTNNTPPTATNSGPVTFDPSSVQGL